MTKDSLKRFPVSFKVETEAFPSTITHYALIRFVLSGGIETVQCLASPTAKHG